MLQPGDMIGVLGGGQLGRMLAQAAARLGLDVHIFTPEADSPASRVAARTTVASFDDRPALGRFARTCAAVTLEFENVPLSAVAAITDQGVAVRPGPQALAASQDRATEKRFLESIGVDPAPWREIDHPDDIAPALRDLGGRGVLKARRSGYDGKGQIGLSIADLDPARAWSSVGEQPSVLEAFIAFDCELSVILARSASGEVCGYDSPRNLHAGGVLRSTSVPGGFPSEVAARALDLTRRLADALDYVGVLTLEFFLTPDGRLLANEFAPRVHNSGHWTLEACAVSQFEQHIRAVAGWPLGSPDRHSNAEMVNLLGDEVYDWRRRMQDGWSVHIYGKRAASPGRKMGHATRLSPRT
ncbi:5-(carboxyamino)imidazole ribonucleotide synthase [bacterium]|nr:5-(carboxyamino)imidazole ribonucleotide synthase [bacterium]